jgi:phosphoribosylglycinamide formyltransferase-1
VIGVLVSGEGSNLQAILDAGHEVVAVASNHPGVKAIDRAQAAGIPTAVFDESAYLSRAERDSAMGSWLVDHGAEVAVLAGYTHLLTPAFLELFPERVINIHPSLLPAFPGPRAIEEALASGERSTGVTVHFVDEGVDTGPLIIQARVAIFEADTVDSLRARIQDVEHRLYPYAITMFLEGKVFFS